LYFYLTNFLTSLKKLDCAALGVAWDSFTLGGLSIWDPCDSTITAGAASYAAVED
jgi:hypothetical protein